MIRSGGLLLAALALGACATKTQIVSPAPPPAASGGFSEAEQNRISVAPLPPLWWRLFGDPVLDAHVSRALAANADIRIAIANLETARASARQAGAARLPLAGVESGAGPDRADRQPSTLNVPKTSYELGATVAYEVDLFGRMRSASAAARADAMASAAALDAARVMIAADTVAAYVDVCGATVLSRLASAQIASQERTISLVARQLQAGEVSPLELGQATALLERTRASLPPFDADRNSALFRLATLQGRTPAEAGDLAIGCTATPQVKAPIPAGDGAALIARRPDIREAEGKLAAATARIGVATADLYPRISLGGSAGLISGGFDAILTPLISWSFLNQGAARAKIAAARGVQAAALANWDAVILRALREVETTLTEYRGEHARNEALAKNLRESAAVATRARARHRLGADAYLFVLEADRSHNDAATLLAASDLKIAQLQVALFRALGGGWESK